MRLNALKSKGFDLFTTSQALKRGVSAQLLGHYLRKGLIERVSHGVYRLTEYQQAFDLDSIIQEKLKAVPQGIIGYKTALRLYDLTEDLPVEIDVVVPATNIPKRKLEDVNLHPVKTDLYRTDVQKIRSIPVTSLERTLVDLLRSGEPMSVVLKICQEAKRKNKVISLTKLKKLGATFRAMRKVEQLIGVLL